MHCGSLLRCRCLRRTPTCMLSCCLLLMNRLLRCNAPVFHCRQVSDAIPIPGLLEGLQPTVQAARSMNDSMSSSEEGDAGSSSGRRAPGLQLPAPSTEAVLAAAAASVPGFLLPEQQLLAGAAPAIDQLTSIVNEVGRISNTLTHVQAHAIVLLTHVFLFPLCSCCLLPTFGCPSTCSAVLYRVSDQH